MKNKILVLLICPILIFIQGCSTVRYIKEHPYKSLSYVAGATLIACAVVAKAYSQNYQSQPVYYPFYSTTYTTRPAYTVASKTSSNHYMVNSIGVFDYVNGSNGYSGTGQQIGKFYYYHDNQGNNYASQAIGQFDYTSGTSGYHGTGQKLGNFYYYNDNQGGRYALQKIGNFDYVSGSNGYHGTGQHIGNFYYYNDNE